MKAPQFELLGVDGKRHSVSTAKGSKGLLVMFICNHCPYVKRSLDRILSGCLELAEQGSGAIAVMPNDPADYSEDSFDNMKRLSADKRFPFPYVIDETQDVARAYGVVCTPRRSSTASTARSSCNTTDASTSLPRRCCRSPLPAAHRRNSAPRSAARSSGSGADQPANAAPQQLQQHHHGDEHRRQKYEKHERMRYRQPQAERRSEEHTSELQSPDHPVCRLLL